MKICLAQIKPQKGNIAANIAQHLHATRLAAEKSAEAIFFPELSLTGYEPDLAKDLALNIFEASLDVFQQLADNQQITIGLGAPTHAQEGVLISMLIFSPHQTRQIYSKQNLHADELPYFVEGKGQLILHSENQKIAPAICYESLLSHHAEKAHHLGAGIYLASVAKSANGIKKAQQHYPAVAQKFGMWVMMVNSVGFCDNFYSAGTTSVWNPAGELLGQLNAEDEGMIWIDTETESVLGFGW
ncbi:MAG: carbon-nitrogen hydrolase family protein [Microscillaceae bacterium]|jgi:predicted amidohydrolase|nr:carbon-nitrogen hydrolase family protein [Microscillaceae bacterium]